MNELEKKVVNNIKAMVERNTYNCPEIYGVIPDTDGVCISTIVDSLKDLGFKGRIEESMGFTFIAIKNEDFINPNK